jgi:hypothetical protein
MRALRFDEGAKALAVPLNPAWLRTLLPPLRAGVYLLLDRDHPRYVGRSDTCLLTRLCGHELRSEATHAVWSLRGDAVGAYRAECYWYHRLNAGLALVNKLHPAAPIRNLTCPFCPDQLDETAAAVHALAEMARGASRSPVREVAA